MNIPVLYKLKHKAKLERLILENAPYEKILKQSQLLDKYIMMEMKRLNPTIKDI